MTRDSGPRGLLFSRTQDDLVDINHISQAGQYVVACLIGIAAYNACEMVPIVLFTFLRYSGLYFWAMVVATLGVLMSTAGLAVSNWDKSLEQSLGTALNTFAWPLMVTGQSLVLFSRLHLVGISPRIRRWVLGMIVVNAVVMHTPTAILTIGSRTNSPEKFAPAYGYAERVQVTVFFVQELILSGIYLWRAGDVLGSYRADRKGKVREKSRRMVLHLVLVNLLVVALDVTILALEFSGLYVVQVSYKAFAYSVKLKCEIGILNRLVDFVKTTRPESFHLTSQVEREWESTLKMTFGLSKDDCDECEKRKSSPPLLQSSSDLGIVEDSCGSSTGVAVTPLPKLAQLPDSERMFVQRGNASSWPSPGAEEEK